MSSGKHTPPGDRSFVVSLLAHLGAGIALVLVVAGGFWGLGQFRAPETTPVITAPDETPDPTPAAVDTPAEEPDEDPDATPPADEPDEVDEPDEADEPRAFDPQEISVQVLDAAGDDGTRMRTAEAQLRDDGYRIVATNRAFRNYEQTTVFYTAGSEDKARQIADQYGYAVVEEKPDNLSDSVDVHLVVGQDHPTG